MNHSTTLNRVKNAPARLGRFFLGPAEQFAMRHRILNGTLLAGVAAMGMGLASEFFREGFETGGLVALWAAFTSSILFYYLSRFRQQFRWLILPTFLIGGLSTLMQIQYSGGIISANIMVLFPLLIMYMLIMGQKFDWMIILAFAATLFGIQYFQSVRPDLFSDYSSDRARSEDFLVTAVTVVLVVGLMLRTLNRSYEDALGEVRRLKDQQDGDYFLTSLLIRPLAGIRNRSQSVHLNTYVKQKKAFQFKSRNHELGGDICVADGIVLRGKKYCVFANGDAMGKSMQGAGGALVFGAAFRALIERTQRESYLSSYFPERWLQEALNDLNSAFAGFDGSMSISLILGLVDESNGFLYYINAEHPFPILVRKGKATFLSEEATNFKVGMLHERARIETFRIRPGDVLIIGSDGRDDLSLGGESGRIINEDHTAILREVERCPDDLERLARNLESNGELTDDLSLLSISYSSSEAPGLTFQNASIAVEEAKRQIEAGQTGEALDILQGEAKRMPESPDLQKLLYETYRSLNQPNNAADAAARFIEIKPGNLQMMYNSAIQYAKAGMLEEAISMAERIQSRKPDAQPVLKLLLRLYEKSGKKEQATVLNGDLMNAGLVGAETDQK